MAGQYNIYSRGAYGWHYGIWDGSVKSIRDASINSNRKLVSGVKIGPGSSVLDVGCGAGGFAIWAAKELGCRVTGITIVPESVDFARRLAKERGVSHLCTFTLMDMADLRFEDESFDLIVNQETLCYAADKVRYFQRLHSLLKPNGRWQSVDFSIKDGPLSAKEEALHKEVCGLWYMAPLAPPSTVEAALKEAQFEDCRTEDLTPLVLHDAHRIVRFCRIGTALTRFKLDKLLFRDAQYREAFRRHIGAGLGYSEGLIGQPFRHSFYTARKR